MSNNKFNVGDKVIYNGTQATNDFDGGAINVGDIGVVRKIGRASNPWPYYVDFGKGGLPAGFICTGSDGVETDCTGLAPMAQGSDINLYEGEAQ